MNQLQPRSISDGSDLIIAWLIHCTLTPTHPAGSCAQPKFPRPDDRAAVPVEWACLSLVLTLGERVHSLNLAKLLAPASGHFVGFAGDGVDRNECWDAASFRGLAQ